MPTTKIGTENARPSKTQNIEDLYNALHAGGAYDAKKDLVTDGSHNERVTSLQERTHTTKGFKTKMVEQQTELKMAMDSKIVTTRMRTSVYGPLDTTKYKP